MPKKYKFADVFMGSKDIEQFDEAYNTRSTDSTSLFDKSFYYLGGFNRKSSQIKKSFWGNLLQSAGDIGRGFVGLVEDSLEAVGLDDPYSAWLDPAYVASDSLQNQESLTHTKGESSYLNRINKENTEAIAQEKLEGLQDYEIQATKYRQEISDLKKDFSNQTRSYREALSEKSGAYEESIRNNNLEIGSQRNIVDSLVSQVDKYRSPSTIQTLFQDRQASTFLPTSFRQRGATGRL